MTGRQTNTKSGFVVSASGGKTISLKSSQTYDTLFIVGQIGGKAVLDIIPLHPTSSIALHLGETETSLISATETSAVIEFRGYTVCRIMGYGQLSY